MLSFLRTSAAGSLISPPNTRCGSSSTIRASWEDRAIESAFLTSRLEGSTYSRKSAALLLKYSITDEKPLSDALMLCDIGATFRYVISTAQERNVLTKDFLCELHAKATGNYQLPEKQQGTVRKKHHAIGSNSRSREELETELEHCLEAARRMDDPFEKAAGIHCGLLRLRYFTDGNRRTARLMETAVLVNHGITPLFPEESGFSSYPGAALSCCERGNVRKYAEFLLRASQQTIDSLLNRGEDFESARREDGERIRKYRSRG